VGKRYREKRELAKRKERATKVNSGVKRKRAPVGGKYVNRKKGGIKGLPSYLNCVGEDRHGEGTHLLRSRMTTSFLLLGLQQGSGEMAYREKDGEKGRKTGSSTGEAVAASKNKSEYKTRRGRKEEGETCTVY